jgi:hypothetical protein
MTPFAEKSLQRLETDRKVLVERRDRDVAGRTQKRKIDVATVAEVEDSRRVQQHEIRAQRRQRMEE